MNSNYKNGPSVKFSVPYRIMSQFNTPPRIIKYVLNPEEYRQRNTENVKLVEYRQVQLFCRTCNTRENLTKDNLQTFVISERYQFPGINTSIATCPVEDHVFTYSPLYGGKCMMKPECM